MILFPGGSIGGNRCGSRIFKEDPLVMMDKKEDEKSLPKTTCESLGIPPVLSLPKKVTWWQTCLETDEDSDNAEMEHVHEAKEEVYQDTRNNQ